MKVKQVKKISNEPIKPLRVGIFTQHKINTIKNLIRKYGTQEIIDGKPNPIRGIAARILTKKIGTRWAVSERDYINEIKAIYTWVQNNIRYQRDPYKKDIIETPIRTLALRIADCDAMTTLIGSLLVSVGYPVQVKVIQQKEGKDLDVYLLVGIPPGQPKRWLPINAIFNKPIGYQPPRSKEAIFRIF